jgi:catechol 2,3-dioxygenase-like lactoylglutathione lyase family enzyme
MSGPDTGSTHTDSTDTDSTRIDCISAVTLVCTDMAASVAFYVSLGFSVRYGGPDGEFTSLHAGPGYVNLQLDPQWQAPGEVWGRVIFWVGDVDALHGRALAAGHSPSTEPSDAPWGERYFHISDPDGHELSFARPLEAAADG